MILKNDLYKVVNVDREEKSYRLELIPDCMIYRAHFPEQPITPGVYIIQVASELLAELYSLSLELTAVFNAKYLAVINPEESKEIIYTFKKVVFDNDNTSVKASVVVTYGDVVFTRLSLGYKIV